MRLARRLAPAVVAALTPGLVPAQDEAPRATADAIPALLEVISAERTFARIETLAGFGTRHTASRTDSETEGIGAARRWIERDLRAASEASGGRLEVRTQSFVEQVRTREGRKEVELVNVYGFLPGSQGDPNGRTYVVSGHYDSINGDPRDTTGAAPGADDDASGTAVVLELARVMSAHEFEANLVFLCVPGEEQGLLGASHFEETARADGLDVAGMFTNDIVGGSFDEEFEQDHGTVRLFTGGDSPDAASRELARLTREAALRYVPGFDVRLVFHLDRNGRGGDHIPFHENGVPAARFTEARENYRRQHKNVSENRSLGDLPEYVSADYVANVARVNAAALARLASAPPPPAGLRLQGAMRDDVRLSWDAVPGAADYEVVWRETTSAEWHHAEVTAETGLVLDLVADDVYLAVRSRNARGHASLAVPFRRR